MIDDQPITHDDVISCRNVSRGKMREMSLKTKLSEEINQHNYESWLFDDLLMTHSNHSFKSIETNKPWN